ncbi:MAG: aminodeoxychorismate synthase component I [Alteromonadaceae bacterium]|nr:MAG: aminodeoxychorismate synthase component I [Alteromonadaceae bacterium]
MTKPHSDVESIPYHNDSDKYFQCLRPFGRRVWLDSGRNDANRGRYDILSAQPLKILNNPSVAHVEQEVAQLKAPPPHSELLESLPFIGGALGYFNYEHDQSRYLKNNRWPQEQLTDSLVGIFNWALIQDHQLKHTYLVFLPCCPEPHRQQIRQAVSTSAQVHTQGHASVFGTRDAFKVTGLTPDLRHADYQNGFEEIQRLIRAGDTYQVNYAQRFSGEFSGSADHAYLTLRKVLPSPYSGFIELGDDSVLSLSPERFIRVQDGHGTTQPIKGTCERSADPIEDEARANALVNSEKNRAENLMIVDLLRNDFNRLCEPFTVKTPKLFALHSFPNVHHLISTVTGKLLDSTSPLQFLHTSFPGGSISGAPKKRAIEIIHALEAHPRNIYCGSLFYLSCHGRLDSNIAIRSLLIHKNRIYCWGGGGITSESKAKEEYDESCYKVQILLDTLKQFS